MLHRNLLNYCLFAIFTISIIGHIVKAESSLLAELPKKARILEYTPEQTKLKKLDKLRNIKIITTISCFTLITTAVMARFLSWFFIERMIRDVKDDTTYSKK